MAAIVLELWRADSALKLVVCRHCNRAHYVPATGSEHSKAMDLLAYRSSVRCN